MLWRGDNEKKFLINGFFLQILFHFTPEEKFSRHFSETTKKLSVSKIQMHWRNGTFFSCKQMMIGLSMISLLKVSYGKRNCLRFAGLKTAILYLKKIIQKDNFKKISFLFSQRIVFLSKVFGSKRYVTNLVTRVLFEVQKKDL